MTTVCRLLVGAALAAGIVSLAPAARALTTLRIEPGAGASVVDGVLEVREGRSASVDVFATIDSATPIIGFGLDLDHDDLLLGASPAAVGSAWIEVFSADGDGLAGLAAPPGVSGDDVLLASVEILGLTRGLTSLSLSVSEDDPSEGFALQAVGAFDVVDFGSALPVLVTPEPGTGVLLGAALAGVAGWRRRRRS
jgi:hypothetical protein